MLSLKCPHCNEKYPIMGSFRLEILAQTLTAFFIFVLLYYEYGLIKDHHEEMKEAEERWRDDDQGRAETWDKEEDEARMMVLILEGAILLVCIRIIMKGVHWSKIALPDLRSDREE